jgi:hypothetical protein
MEISTLKFIGIIVILIIIDILIVICYLGLFFRIQKTINNLQQVIKNQATINAKLNSILGKL